MNKKVKIVKTESSRLEELIAELDDAVSRCGPKLYRIARDGGVAYIYHSNRHVLVIWPESVLTENNLNISNEMNDLLMEYASIHVLEFAKATWQEYNKQPADCFLDWVKENHPEIEPFEAEYIGPEMKDMRTKFGTYYENGERIIYN